MRKFVITALAGAMLLPALATPAFAAPYPAAAADRHDDRYDRRDDRRDDRYDRRDDRRDDRYDRRDDRYDRRDDRAYRWHDNDWSDYRRVNRNLYARGYWQAPFRYYGFRPGVRITPVYYNPRYVIADPWRYRLPPVAPYLRYVRHYNDVLVVDVRRGVVVRVYNNFYW